MIDLPNGCRCSNLAVHPKNWMEPGARLKDPWYINYRFYDSAGNSKQVAIRGMNAYKTLADRRRFTKRLLEKEMDELVHEGYNPITGQSYMPADVQYEIPPTTPFCLALRKALTRLHVVPKTAQDIKNVLPLFEKAAIHVNCNNMPVGEVKRKHVKIVLEQCGKLKPKWSANLFNHYRKYLSILFTELLELDAVEFNPVKQIAKQKTVRRIRPTLTREERDMISAHLKSNHYRFWLFMQVFFHGGSRETELLKVQGRDVNLAEQYFKVTVIKGKARREVRKTIKDVAVPFWKEVLRDCGPDQYVFSEGLVPGAKTIRPEQIIRRWKTHVKDKLGIEAGLYSLKYTNSDETASLLSIEDAQKHNSHTSKKTTLLYAINEGERQNERIRKLGNEF